MKPLSDNIFIHQKIKLIPADRVKEFIKELKERMYEEFESWTNGDGCKPIYDNLIKELAGDVLVGSHE